MSEEEDRMHYFICSSNNPIVIRKKNNEMFSKIYIDDIIIHNEDNISLTKDLVSLEISENVDANYERFGKSQNRIIGLFHPNLAFSAWNKENGSLMLFSNDNSYSFSQTHEISLYFKENASGNLLDFKNISIIIIYSF